MDAWRSACYTPATPPPEETRVLRRSYDWVMRLAARPDANWALAAISFIESSVFPIPPSL